MKTILYIGGFELPDKNAAAQRVMGNAKILRALGYRVILIGVDKGQESGCLSDKFTVESFECYSIKYPNSLTEWLTYLSSNHFLNTLSLADVSHIIAYNYPSLAFLKLKRLCANNKMKLVADCTEWHEPTGGFIFRLIKGADINLRMKYIQTKLDGLIVISDYLESYYKSKVTNLINIPPLIDLNMPKWGLIHQNSNSNIVQFVYAGSPGVGPKDKIDIVVHAFKEVIDIFEDFRFVVIGITKQQYESSFNDYSITGSLDEKIQFKGRLRHEEAIDEVKKSDYYIFVRDQNLINSAGFPTKFVESVSCGVPVITNASSNVKNFIIDGEDGFLLESIAVDSIKNKLLEIMSFDKNRVSEIKQKAHAKRNLFHYENYMNVFKNLF